LYFPIDKSRSPANNLNFIFQPAEKGIGGAKAMLHDGLFERFAIRAGPMMAGGDIAVTGKGSHAARPDEGIDPVLTASR
jgi:hippurate hydrolase